MVEIFWTKISLEDLKEIYDFISLDSIRYATITVNKIYQKVQFIKENPYLARTVPEFNDKNIREIIYGNYRIVFKIIDVNLIHILRVYHTSRSLKRSTLE
jgi:toxin ParE1/3/4